MRGNHRLSGCGLVAALVVAGCGGGADTGSAGSGGASSSSSSGSGAGGAMTPPPLEDLTRDILHTGLEVDLAAFQATATIDLAAGSSLGASFEAEGLTVQEVLDDKGTMLQFAADPSGRLDVGVPLTKGPPRLVIKYGFAEQKPFQGLMKAGSTLVWPYYCGNLFPCHSDPSDGMTFDVTVMGATAGKTTIAPPPVLLDAPSYMLAWATGEYTALDLGTTKSGTHLTAYYLPNGLAAAQKGTAKLVDVFGWYEDTYGPYPFGKESGSVAATWGPGAYGGMEHHPLVHIADIAFGDPWIHAHEAAHGWFGDGVRIACWEDFVLSEGTVSYLEARSIGQVMGAAEGQKVWDQYQSRLLAAMGTAVLQIAWPDGCGKLDILKDQLFSDIPYVKGAFFYKALEGKIGAPALDAALKKFLAMYVGKAAHFSDLLAVVKAESGYDAAACAQSWLKSAQVPAQNVCP
jgi:hypothetical protein